MTLALLCLVVGGQVIAEEPSVPTQGDVDTIRERVQRARAAIAATELNPGDRTRLQKQLSQIEIALAHYEDLARRGQKRRVAQAPLYLAGMTVLTDDVSGVGVADDVLLPLVALGLMATHLWTQPPVPDSELRGAWDTVLSRLRIIAGTTQSLMGNLSGKERASDIPSWAKGCKMKPEETPAQAADRILKERYPDGNFPRGPGSEHNKIKKFFERAR